MKFKKKIKSSNRGITFSDSKMRETKFKIGTSYNYFIDKDKREVVILPSTKGNSVSRKKSGDEFKPLIDIRSKKAIEALKGADFFEIEAHDDKIVVHGHKKEGVKKVDEGYNNNVVDAVGKFTTKRTISAVIEKELLKVVNSTLGGQLDLFKTIDQQALETHLRGAKKSSEGLNINKSIKDRLAKDNQSKPNLLSLDGLREMLSVISYFSGAGFLDKAFMDQGFKIKYASDVNPDVKETYEKNIGNHFEVKDILDLIELPDEEFPKAFVSIGGVDCHPFANANRTKRLSEHENYGLVDAYADAVIKGRNSIFVIENVPAILNDPMYLRAEKKLTNEGFEISKGILIDADFGGVQATRKRAIVIGSKIGKIELPKPFVKADDYKSVGEAFIGIDESDANHQWINSRKKTVERISQIPQGGNFEDLPENMKTKSMKKIKTNGKPSTHSSTYRRLKMDEPAPTIINYRKSIISHPTEDRIISHREALRLFSMPDDFVAYGTSNGIVQMIANAVPYTLGKAIAKKVKEFIVQIAKSVKTQPKAIFA